MAPMIVVSKPVAVDRPRTGLWVVRGLEPASWAMCMCCR